MNTDAFKVNVKRVLGRESSREWLHTKFGHLLAVGYELSWQNQIKRSLFMAVYFGLGVGIILTTVGVLLVGLINQVIEVSIPNEFVIVALCSLGLLGSFVLSGIMESKSKKEWWREVDQLGLRQIMEGLRLGVKDLTKDREILQDLTPVEPIQVNELIRVCLEFGWSEEVENLKRELREWGYVSTEVFNPIQQKHQEWLKQEKNKSALAHQQAIEKETLGLLGLDVLDNSVKVEEKKVVLSDGRDRA